jgi:hypothetical protein
MVDARSAPTPKSKRAAAPEPVAVAARRPIPPAAPPAASEHIFLGSDDRPDPSKAGRTVRERVELRNALRGSTTDVTLFEEGVVQIVEHSKGTAGVPFRLDLHYLDPVPSITRVIAERAFLTSLGCVLAALAALLLARVGALQPVAIPAALLAVCGALTAAAVAVYRSHERISFHTIHGRACVLSLVANFGSIKRFRAFVPVLSRAIEESAEQITDDTSSYLRAEMREHYRLRGDGVLSDESCAESTGRILAQFDIQI